MELLNLLKRKEEQHQAQKLADELKLEIVDEAEKLDSEKLHLRMDSEGLTLVKNGLELRGDFTRMLPRLRENNLRSELLVRAAKIKAPENLPYAIDATAGLGEDALLLAAVGFDVHLYEYNPVIAALLEDALLRAGKDVELRNISSRMHLHKENSVEEMSRLTEEPELILLDPMFPARQKSGLVKKKFQLLQHLEQPCTTEEELIHAALAAKPKKIVIKRPPKGPFLAGLKPSYSIEGKGIRFDCLVR